jgi:hypothetical protein
MFKIAYLIVALTYNTASEMSKSGYSCKDKGYVTQCTLLVSAKDIDDEMWLLKKIDKDADTTVFKISCYNTYCSISEATVVEKLTYKIQMSTEDAKTVGFTDI